MPRPRFNKLAPEKRARILETAAKEFATHGYDGASLNQILEKAEVSKGAAYYYFDDKADLFLTVLDYYTPELNLIETIDIATLTAENFWTIMLDIYRKLYLHAYEQPWAFGVLRASAQLYRANPQHPELMARAEKIWGWSQPLFQRGQELGVIRTDLPEELLIAAASAADTAADEWFLQHWQSLSLAEIERITVQTTDFFRRILMPGL